MFWWIVVGMSCSLWVGIPGSTFGVNWLIFPQVNPEQHIRSMCNEKQCLCVIVHQLNEAIIMYTVPEWVFRFYLLGAERNSLWYLLMQNWRKLVSSSTTDMQFVRFSKTWLRVILWVKPSRQNVCVTTVKIETGTFAILLVQGWITTSCGQFDIKLICISYSFADFQYNSFNIVTCLPRPRQYVQTRCDHRILHREVLNN